MTSPTASVREHDWQEITGGVRCARCGLKWMTPSGGPPGKGEAPECWGEQSLKHYLTAGEQAVLAYLAEAYNSFSGLEVLHPSDSREFEQAIHVAQNIVLSRIAIRMIRETK